jgi:hypothetical protein
VKRPATTTIDRTEPDSVEVPLASGLLNMLLPIAVSGTLSQFTRHQAGVLYPWPLLGGPFWSAAMNRRFGFRFGAKAPD